MSTITSIQKGRVSAKIDSMGAQLSSLMLDGAEYLWQADPAVWGKHAPVLFPIVGSLRDKTAESVAGTCHMERHGVARISEHKLVELSEDGSSATFELVENEETLAAYPYKFKLNMTYAVTGEATLAQTFRVVNTGDVALPFSVGGHPAFNVPAPGAGDEAFEDYVVKFAEPFTCKVPRVQPDGLANFDEALDLPGSDTLPLTHHTFDNDSLMFTDVPGNTLTLLGTKSGHGVKIDFEGFKYIAVWSAVGEAPFVALEPWTGYTTATSEDDVFEHKANITVLAPGEVDERTFFITLL